MQAGTSVTFTAVLNDTSATGAVIFYDPFPSTVLGSAVLSSSGEASVSTAALVAGTNLVQAVYLGETRAFLIDHPPKSFLTRR
jgi:hypothetical protein